ncbi:hypothetical protein GGI52_004709 [Pseudomonas moraviensis]|uniref:Uncharacterized protein n=1 Tax=Pseudomonas moraviensis TaxID=321662 RepID=A0A7Y9VZX2_9PSED|nr:hypothetical protein [Pseudomonas moraviensis]
MSVFSLHFNVVISAVKVINAWSFNPSLSLDLMIFRHGA